MTRQERASSDHKHVVIIGTRGYPSYYGGFETAVRMLAPFLVNKGWKVTVYGRENQVRTDDPHRDPRVESIVTPGVDSKSASTLSYGLTSVLHALFHKPDVALVMNVANGFWLPLLRLRGIPCVVNVDGIEWHRAKWGRAAKKLFVWGARLTAKFANHLVFDAEAIASYWKKNFNRVGTFIPYGGESPGWLPVEPGLENKKYVLVVARFVPENTILEFLEAAEEIAEEYDVVIVGSGAPQDPIQVRVTELVERSRNIHWFGHVSDDRRLYSLWQHSGVYFHGHSVGGTNPALVQAMACGANILARDTVFNREVLGDAGSFAEPTPMSIAHGVRTLMHDQAGAETNRSLAQERAAGLYSWNLVNERYEQVLLSHVLSAE